MAEEGFDLSRKIGPLPIGAWIAVVAGGLAIGYFINRDQTSQDTSESQPSQEPSYLQRESSGTGGAQVFVPTPPQQTQPESDEITTNAEWAEQAVNWLISEGKDPGISDNALRKYIAGQDPTMQEQALINLVLQEFGAPPEPLPPVDVPEKPDNPSLSGVSNLRATKKTTSSVTLKWSGVSGASEYFIDEHSPLGESQQTISGTRFQKTGLASDTVHFFTVYPVDSNGNRGPGERIRVKTNRGSQSDPEPKPEPEPEPQRTYTVQSGDTLSEIAQKMYGSAYPEWRRIYNANRGKIESIARQRGYSHSSGGKWIFPGTTLVIP